MSAAADGAAGLKRLTVPQPITDGQGTAAAPTLTGTALSLVFPCYNEAERLPQTLTAYLAELPRQPGEVEILVVDDGSTDQTFAVAQAIAAQDGRVRVIRSQPNHGKGFGVRAGVLQAKGELIVFTDADGSYGPAEVAGVTAALTDAPVAIGCRPAGWATGPPARRLASRLFNRAIQALLGLPYRDTQCGLKGFRRHAAVELFGRARLDGFAFDVELLFLARRLGLAVTEVPVRAEVRDGSKVQLVVDALGMLGDVLRVRRWALSGGYDGAVSVVPDPTPRLQTWCRAPLGRTAGPMSRAQPSSMVFSWVANLCSMRCRAASWRLAHEAGSHRGRASPCARVAPSQRARAGCPNRPCP